MTTLDFLFLLSLSTVLILLLFGRRPMAGWFAVAAYAMQLIMLLAIWKGFSGDISVPSSFHFMIQGHQLHWGMNGLGWFFALITIIAAMLTSAFSAGEWGQQQKNMHLQHVAMAVNVFAMLLLLSSMDFLSLFIGWELVSWAAYLMMTQRGGKAADAAFRYLLYAMAGAMMLLTAIVLINVRIHSFQFEAFWDALPVLPSALLWTISLLFVGAFGIKMALLPFHLWQATAYSETPGAGAAFLNAIAARMGLFALLIVLLKPIGMERLQILAMPLFAFIDAQSLLLWLAALTAIIPTFIALQQTDARLLLTWHGIGQGGFMLLGLAVGTPMGIAGGLLHILNYASYQAALFLAVTAVIYRAGTADLDRLGGLITRMPWTFIVLLMGIIGLAGLPPMNGFVSKWLIYKSLMDANMPMLLVAASISTLGTILSVYKLIHNIFLGQLRKAHFTLKEAPLSMIAPMLILVLIAFVTGAMPGLALTIVDAAQAALGYDLLPHHLGGITWPSGSLNMLWVTGILFYGIGIGAVIFLFLGNKRHVTHQWDNYAGGHFLSAKTPYQYSHNFYPGLMRIIGGWFGQQVLNIEMGLRHFAKLLSEVFYDSYQVVYASLYLVAALVVTLALIVKG
ncbi:proton-conducting transporter transmembrane domain-containing protein [Candidatus Venteria ishoeyi]|uniref:Hydrogenase-4 component B n=1 Tax=Candidatus Venteria ishoeyi TaxID=1899563 RepID=A0A1H6FFC6_9GAMM|nr:proton-conducting transporter membrane subunit [Candidatus Venteria ishoeyi]MDM8547073.1 proton-conducting transporter membrane subunit [Candidatus Venteria ishoeyi]SEH07714.1 Hydrogenase-4 component B [Candidatus Venteria ishoeyi]